VSPSPSLSPTAAAQAAALALAREAIGLSEPNPRVGCVLVGPDGQVVGSGHTQRVGGPHAEIVALRQAGPSARGATAYVTLEPCSHHGRTPPCCDALIAAGVARVVVAVQDPNPLVAGQGIARLRSAGVEVVLADEAVGRESRELNIGFFSRMIRGRPWVRMKVAATLDGRTALPDGRSQWITGEAARRDGHAWRKRAGAVLTGVGTVREDDPRFDVRLVDIVRQPLRVIVDSRLETPTDARILQPPGDVLIYAVTPPEDRRLALAEHAQVVLKPGADDKVDLPSMLDDLAARGINELHVEAGHKLNGSFVREGLVDEFLVYLAPKLLGAGREMAAFGPLASLDDALQLEWVSIDRVGDDLRLIARPHGRADF
jgi:diaminohydroxyphosphoribosylaminopyrimidine deaminase/5-amino-6-(5-phosphoribosylamino)uracil reductase